MFDNKPFEEIEKQAKHVIDLLNQEGARKKAIALKPFVPAEPLPQTASKFGGRPYLPCRGVCAEPMRRVSRWA